MKKRHILEQAISIAYKVEGNGNADGARLRRLRRKLRRLEAANPAPLPRTWTWDRATRVTMPRGGWMKQGVTSLPGYSIAPHYVHLPESKRVGIRQAWAGHVLPVWVQNSKSAGGMFPVYDYWNEPGLVLSRLQELRDANVCPLLFMASDDDARDIGLVELARRLGAVWPHWGSHVGSVCPRIEAGEELMADLGHPTSAELNAVREQARVWGLEVRSIVGSETPLWLHLNADLHLNPQHNGDNVYDGLLRQEVRKKGSGQLRDGNTMYEHVAGDGAVGKPYGGPQDLITYSPVESAVLQDLIWVGFETTSEPTDTIADWDDCVDGMRRACRRFGLVERYG